MTEDAKQDLKNEAEDDLDGPICGLNRKSLKKELVPKDEIDDDDVPLALSKAGKKKPSMSPKVKKQETEDDEDEKPLKKKEVSKKISKTKSVKTKLDSEEEEDEKPHKSKKRKRMEEKKAVKKVKKVSVSLKKGNNDVKQKKVYELPGQKHDPPDMRDPLRIFYETLYEKVPTSEMAATWLMERGLLPLQDAQKVYEKKLRKHHVQKFGSPAKVTPAKKSSAISVKKVVKVISKTISKKVKKKLSDSEEDEDDDDDFDFIKKKTGSKKKSGNKKSSSDKHSA